MPLEDIECEICGIHFFFLTSPPLRDEAVGDGVEGEAGRGFDAQLGGDVFAVRQDGVDTDVEAGGDLLVRQALDDEAEDCLLYTSDAADD